MFGACVWTSKGGCGCMHPHPMLFPRWGRVVQVDGEYPPHRLRGSNMSPKPSRLPVMLICGYVDRVLKRAALNGGWLTYFFAPSGFAQSWAQGFTFAEEGGARADRPLYAPPPRGFLRTDRA